MQKETTTKNIKPELTQQRKKETKHEQPEERQTERKTAITNEIQQDRPRVRNKYIKNARNK